MEKTFVADYKGTCALCWCSVKPGDVLVRTPVAIMGESHERNVHEACQRKVTDRKS